MKPSRLLSVTAPPLLLAVGLVFLVLRKTVDTDAWMHLSLGRLIVESGGIPERERFVFTALDQPFLYSSWLFGVALYGLHSLAGFPGVVLLKTAAALATFAFLYRDAARDNAHPAWAGFWGILVTAASASRFVERPEVLGYAALAFTTLAVGAHLARGSRILWWIPVSTLVWANVHSSVVLVVVPFAVGMAGGALQLVLTRRHSLPFAELPSFVRIRNLGMALVVSLAAGLANPNGPTQYFFGRGILKTDFYKDEITEFATANWSNAKLTWSLLAAMALVLLLHVMVALRARARGRSVVFPSPSAWLTPLLLVPLAVDAIRFGVLLGVAAVPPLARSCGVLHEELNRAAGRWAARTLTAIALVAPVAVPLATVAGLLPFSGPASGFGFGEDTRFVPASGLRYLDSRGVEGPVFNTFQHGGFIAWRGWPRRSVFVDPRGHVPIEVLERGLRARSEADEMEALHQLYGFEALVLAHPKCFQGEPGCESGIRDDKWALVSWDDITATYLRRDGRYASIAAADEYRLVKPHTSPSTIAAMVAAPERAAAVRLELERNVQTTGSDGGRMLLGVALVAAGEYERAVSELTPLQARLQGARLRGLLNTLGLAHLRQRDWARAADVLERAAREGDPDPLIFTNLGTALVNLRRDADAKSWLEKAILLDPSYEPPFVLLSELHLRTGEAPPRGFEELRSKGERTREARATFARAMAHYDGGDLAAAKEAFLRVLELDPSSAVAASNLGYVLLDSGQLDESLVQQRRAVELDPRLANAHYGIALVLKRKGDLAGAERGWREYLRLEPSGYFSRQAKQELAALLSAPAR